jgi:hypothetical protein
VRGGFDQGTGPLRRLGASRKDAVRHSWRRDPKNRRDDTAREGRGDHHPYATDPAPDPLRVLAHVGRELLALDRIGHRRARKIEQKDICRASLELCRELGQHAVHFFVGRSDGRSNPHDPRCALQVAHSNPRHIVIHDAPPRGAAPFAPDPIGHRAYRIVVKPDVPKGRPSIRDRARRRPARCSISSSSRPPTGGRFHTRWRRVKAAVPETLMLVSARLR